MIRAVAPVGPNWYLAASDEVFLNLPPAPGARAYDQNRAFAGVGRKIGRHTRVEAGYMQQTLLQRNARVMELNHTVHLALYSVLPFGRRCDAWPGPACRIAPGRPKPAHRNQTGGDLAKARFRKDGSAR